MNLETVLMCAHVAARQQMSGFGFVDAEVQALIDELTPAPVVEEVAEAEEAAPEAEEIVAVVEEAVPAAEDATALAAFLDDVPHEQFTHKEE
jgi:hypothetical protein